MIASLRIVVGSDMNNGIKHPRMASALCALAVGLAVTAVFSQMVLGAWEYQHYDDMSNYDRNPYIQSMTVTNLRSIVTGGVLLSVYEPFSLIFKMCVRCLIGRSAETNALVSVVLHALNTIGALIFSLSTTSHFLTPFPKNLKQPHDADKNIILECCGMAALLMGLHPLRVQTISWLSCQPYLLASGLCQLALFFHIFHRAANSLNSEAVSIWKAVSVVFYASACMAKATGKESTSSPSC
jgi:hypothetical protein